MVKFSESIALLLSAASVPVPHKQHKTYQKSCGFCGSISSAGGPKVNAKVLHCVATKVAQLEEIGTVLQA